MPYKLLALALDGTCFGEDLVPSPRTLAALAAARSAAGVTLTLATGRTFAATRPFADLLGADGPLICYQGAWVRDAAGATLLHRTVPRPIAAEVVTMARAAGWQCNLYIADQAYVEAFRPEADIYFQLNRNTPPVVVPDLAALARETPQEPTKLVLVLPAEPDTDACVRAIAARFGDAIYTTKSHARFAEVVHPAVDKGAALAAVAAHLGVPQAETMAVGDGMNDLPMLRWAGLGVAMGQAHADIRAAADVVTAPLAEDGLAQAIERWVLRGGIGG